MIGFIFGLIDSMCKNLTLRNWGGDQWYTSFYDMDTAFGLNNSGEDIVPYWAHFNRYYNTIGSGTSLYTIATQENHYRTTDDQIQYFNSWWTRIWEIIENLDIKDPGNIPSGVFIFDQI